MDTTICQSPSRWVQRREAVVTASVEWMPLPLGVALRKLLYRTIFASFGTPVVIEPGVEFVGADRMEIGDRVTIQRDSRLRVLYPTSKICIRDGVFLDLGVDIKAHSHENGEIEIGENAYIGPYTCLSGANIKIGKSCLIASHSGIYANNHNYADSTCKIREQGLSYKGIVIEDDCWIGSGVKVLDGVTIGKGSIIGAGAVVTKSIPPYSIAVGIPAKVVSQRSTKGKVLPSELAVPAH